MAGIRPRRFNDCADPGRFYAHISTQNHSTATTQQDIVGNCSSTRTDLDDLE
jgi:hypothetical protein